MTKKIILGINVILLGLTFLSAGVHLVKAQVGVNSQGNAAREYHLLAAATPLPTAEIMPVASATPQARVLPPVGKNAGLVFGAGVLVLIILVGVLSSRLRTKH